MLKHLKNVSHYGANRREDKVSEAADFSATLPQQASSASEVATEVVELQPPGIPEEVWTLGRMKIEWR